TVNVAVTVTDSSSTQPGASSSNSFSIDVIARAPVLTGRSVRTIVMTHNRTSVVNRTHGLLSSFNSPDGERLRIQLLRKPLYGRLTIRSDGSFTYLPKKNFKGRVSFVYRVTDGVFASHLVTVYLQIR